MECGMRNEEEEPQKCTKHTKQNQGSPVFSGEPHQMLCSADHAALHPGRFPEKTRERKSGKIGSLLWLLCLFVANSISVFQSAIRDRQSAIE
jgi:hypothetical protein